jgi:hypothetical protein
MNTIATIARLCLGCAAMLGSAWAADFDGSRALICASTQVTECDAGAACRQVSVESIDAPQFFRIDFKAKTIRLARALGDARSTQIDRMETVDGKLVLQGVEDGQKEIKDGLGWSLAISQDRGGMVLTGSGDETAFVIFGACTPL